MYVHAQYLHAAKQLKCTQVHVPSLTERDIHDASTVGTDSENIDAQNNTYT